MYTHISVGLNMLNGAFCVSVSRTVCMGIRSDMGYMYIFFHQILNCHTLYQKHVFDI